MTDDFQPTQGTLLYLASRACFWMEQYLSLPWWRVFSRHKAKQQARHYVDAFHLNSQMFVGSGVEVRP